MVHVRSWGQMLAAVATKVGGLIAQRAVQVGLAGLLTGAVIGIAAVAIGLVPLVPAPPKMIALLECPDSDRVVARVPSGQTLLVTARSFDGHWVEVYLGQAGVDRAWAQANAVRLEAGDRLPVGECRLLTAANPSSGATAPASGATAAPLDTFGPPSSVIGVVTAPPEPTVLPPGVTPGPTAVKPPTATPLNTLIYPSVFYPSPPPASQYPTGPPPPTPTPTPTPFVDTTAPTLSSLHGSACLDGTANHTTVDIYVTATDPDDLVVQVRLFVRPPGPFIGSYRDMSSIGGGLWKYVLTWSHLWDIGFVEYSAYGLDSHGNPSVTVVPSGPNTSIEVRANGACSIN